MFLGTPLAGVAIFIDIGRYWNGYNLFLPWHVNFNSVLVEVALCIAAYVVLWIELAPTILEKYQDKPFFLAHEQLPATPGRAGAAQDFCGLRPVGHFRQRLLGAPGTKNLVRKISVTRHGD